MAIGVIVRVAIAIGICAAVAFAVRAETAPSSEGGRYLLRKSEDGWFRVDQNTGQASLCRQGDVGFTCELVPDDRDALLDEITRLAEENAMLRAQVARGGKPSQLPGEPDVDGKKDDDLNLPAKEDIDRMMEVFRSMVDRFVAMVDDLRQDFEKKAQ